MNTMLGLFVPTLVTSLELIGVAMSERPPDLGAMAVRNASRTGNAPSSILRTVGAAAPYLQAEQGLCLSLVSSCVLLKDGYWRFSQLCQSRLLTQLYATETPEIKPLSLGIPGKVWSSKELASRAAELAATKDHRCHC